MKKHVILSLVMTLWTVSCSLSTIPQPSKIPVMGSTAAPSTVPSLAPSNGWVLFFDGQDDYVVVKDSPSLDLQNSFTIAAWVYLEEYTEWASIVTKGDKPNINNYALQQSGPNDPVYKTQFGRLRFSGCASLSAPLPESDSVLLLKKWYFVAATFDGSRIRFYVNGKEAGSDSVTGPLCTNNESLYIGVDFPLTTEYWHGAIDELRIWNVALPESQIQQEMKVTQLPLPPTLVGYWTFNEGSGTMAHDITGHGNDGLLIGNPAWVPRDALTP